MYQLYIQLKRLSVCLSDCLSVTLQFVSLYYGSCHFTTVHITLVQFTTVCIILVQFGALYCNFLTFSHRISQQMILGDGLSRWSQGMVIADGLRGWSQEMVIADGHSRWVVWFSLLHFLDISQGMVIADGQRRWSQQEVLGDRSRGVSLKYQFRLKLIQMD